MTAIHFKNTVQREAKSLRKYAYQLTRNIDDTDDLVQETMLKAFTYEDKFQEGTNLKGWLYTIMKNTFINNYRRMVKRNTFIDSTNNEYFIDSFAVTEVNKGEQKFIMQDIEACIEKLPLNLKTPFTMSFNGYKYEEIAVMLNIPIGTVKTRIFVAKRELKGQLGVYAKMYGYDKISEEVAA
ncbi:MAG: RNA polymerase sigma factor [Bacteroidia bacterium]